MLMAAFIAGNPVKAQDRFKGDTAHYPYWIEMMQDPSVNFFKVQKAFETYWEGRSITRGCGWKPFKRWEYMTSQRIYADGTRPSPTRNQDAWRKYLKEHHKLENTTGNWVELGPRYLPQNAPGLGRLNAIAFHPSNPEIMWVGAPSGGLWKTVDGGQFWTSSTDNLPTLGVSSILIDHSNPDILYIGTGDRDAGDAPGLGVMKSTDGGVSWQSINSTMGNVVVGKMLMHPLNPQLIYAATSGGIYRSDDGGINWNLVSPNTNHYKDLAFKPDNPNVIYATTGGSFYKSVNGGSSWVQITNGLPGGYRAVIGVTPANPDIVYVLEGNSDSYKGMYLSTDGGNTFVTQSTAPNILSWGCDGGDGGQSWYDLAVAVDPTDQNVVYVGGVNVFKSTDAGQTWVIVGHWWGDCDVAFIHADQHVFEWNPLNGRLYVGNDGGCFYTDNEGTDWIMISQGLAIAQVYKIGQSATVSDLVINGYQDNGTAVYADSTWINVMGADGMECAIDPVNPLYKYGTVYYGVVKRIYNFTGQGDIGGSGINGITESGAWVSPFIIHETDPNTMFLGLKSVWRSNNIKNLSTSTVTWSKISGNFGSGNCEALEQSPADPDLLYLIKENGKVVRTDHANASTPTWIDLTNNLPINLDNPSDIEAHPTKPDWAYLSSNGGVFKTTDRGATWTDISGSLPDVFFSSIVYCKGSQEGLYLASDVGVFYRDASMCDWIPFKQGLPDNGRVTELDMFIDQNDPENNRIRACTYGRGLWESTLYQTQPIAGFTSDYTEMSPGCGIQFEDLSLGFPTSWHWSFPGGNPSTSNLQNPGNISYSTPGNYDVQLIASNSTGSDTLLLPGYITISGSILPQVGFYVSDSVFCSGNQVVTFYDTSHYCPSSWLWTFVPPTVAFLNGTSATSQNPVVQFLEDGAYTVTLTVNNQNGSANITHQNLIKIGGFPLPFTEDFESGNLNAKAWTIVNPDNDVTWDVTGTGGNSPGDQSARMRIYGSNSLGRRDWLISPPLDMTGMEHAALFYKHAYCQYEPAYSDTLIIMASDNCGVSWDRLFTGFEDGSGSFATRPPMNTSFTPAAESDWCGSGFGSPCLLVDLSSYAGKKNVKIAFQAVSYMSNNIYLDNINIEESSGLSEQDALYELSIFPNPASERFRITANRPIQRVSLLNVLGVKLDNKEVNEPQTELDVSSLRSGIYVIKIVIDNHLLYRTVQII